MRISDWSSDVCSSDLRLREFRVLAHARRRNGDGGLGHGWCDLRRRATVATGVIVRVRRLRHLGLYGGGRSRHSPRLHRGLRARLPEFGGLRPRSEEHTSELPSLMRTAYAVFCLKTKSKQPTCTKTRA